MRSTETKVKPYTFPATEEERSTANVFGWLLPTLPPLRCQRPAGAAMPLILPILLPPRPSPAAPLPIPPAIIPPSPTVVQPQPEAPEVPAPPPPPPAQTVLLPPVVEEAMPPVPPPEPVEPIPEPQVPPKAPKEMRLARREDEDASDPEELVVEIPPKEEVAPKLDTKDDGRKPALAILGRRRTSRLWRMQSPHASDCS